MTTTKMPQRNVSATIDALKWAATGDDAEAAAETRRRSRLTGPECVALLRFVVISDTFASPAQRVRAASTLLEVGQFLSSEAKETGLFHEPENGADEREKA